MNWAIDPLISIVFEDRTEFFEPGSTLTCQYQVDAIEAENVQAIEASILWFTEGKGETDMGVHFFQRRSPTDAEGGDLRHMHRFRTVLPKSPLTYDGVLLKVRWLVRVRLFLKKGKDTSAEAPFRLGRTTRVMDLLL